MSDQTPSFPNPMGGDEPIPPVPAMPTSPPMMPAGGIPTPPAIEWSAPGMPLPATAYTQAPPPAIPLADAWLRFAARFIDKIIMGLIGCIPAIGISGSAAAVFGNSGSGGALSGLSAQVASSFVSAIIVLLYDGVATATLGGTLMKRAFGMRVVNQSDGQPVNMQTALTRAAPLAVLTAIPILGGIGVVIMGIVSLIFLFSDKLRQTVSDKLAKTVVIKAN